MVKLVAMSLRSSKRSMRKSRIPKKLLLVAGIIIWLALSAMAQVRTTISFDNDWLFQKGDVTGAQAAKLNDSTWRRLDVPHDWSIEGPFDAKNPTAGSGGFLPSGVG